MSKHMNYEQAINFINEVSSSTGMVFGLESINSLLKKAGNPDKNLKIVHIAGTNGKGSVGTFMAEMLESSGLKTGRFYSPALFDYQENFEIRNDGYTRCISKEQIASYMSEIRDYSIEVVQEGFRAPTAFEMETVMALMFMADEGCDICLVECGLGGRDDATNVIKHNILEVITSISYDHCRVLGNTLDEIAQNKCGIITNNSVVVTTNQNKDVIAVIEDECDKNNAKLVIADTKNCTVRQDNIYGIVYDDNKNGIEGISLTVTGGYQIENSYLAICAVLELNKQGFNISENDIKNGLMLAKWKGRFDVISSSPLIIADGAHNEGAAVELKKSVDKYLSDYKKIYVMGVFKDKQYNKILSIMEDRDGIFFTGKSDNKRSLESEELKKKATTHFNEVISCSTITCALEQAVETAKKYNDKCAIICFGSLSIMKEIYDLINKNKGYGMSRLDRIYEDEEFQNCLEMIENYEKKRIFCGHGMSHLLDVARITWILNIENGYGFEKEVVYAAAMLHDIGRSVQYENGTNHEKAGVAIARRILNRSGFSDNERNIIIGAISFHNQSEDISNKNNLLAILKNADNRSRQCYLCKAKDNCKWPHDRMNLKIEY